MQRFQDALSKVVLMPASFYFHGICNTAQSAMIISVAGCRKKTLPMLNIDGVKIEKIGEKFLLRFLYNLWDPTGDKKPCQIYLMSNNRIVKTVYNAIPPRESDWMNLIFICLDAFNYKHGDLSLAITRESSVEEGESAINEGRDNYKADLFCFK